MGCLLIGVADGLPPRRSSARTATPDRSSPSASSGGSTTFSTYTADTNALLRDGQGPLALAYLFAAWCALFATSAPAHRRASAGRRHHPRHRRSTP